MKMCGFCALGGFADGGGRSQNEYENALEILFTRRTTKMTTGPFMFRNFSFPLLLTR